MLEYKEYIGLSIGLYNIGPHAHLVREKDSVDNGPVSSGTQVRSDLKDQTAQTEQLLGHMKVIGIFSTTVPKSSIFSCDGTGQCMGCTGHEAR